MRCQQCDAVLPPEARFCQSCGARVEGPAPGPASDPLFETLTKTIGFQYRIERLLGRGGMGAVYLARELALDRDVAIKVLPPDQAGTPLMRERFRREARTAARLSHPHIVPLHTFGEVAGLTYFVMGYVPGESLASRLERQGALPPEEARGILAALCDALAYAHRQGVVHRDIKPDNILIDSASGAPLLTDFGIARPPLGEGQLTTTGQVLGTPYYMSPEQARGRTDVDGRSDLYSLGIVAYEMLAGRRPFEGESPLDALAQRLTREPKPLELAAPGIPTDLARAVGRCLQRDPERRWPDAKALGDALSPQEEEVDYSPPVRVLHTISTVVLPITLLAIAHLWLLDELDPALHVASRVYGLLGSVVASLMLASAMATARLRLQGIAFGTILTKAFQQPTWTRSWYPRSLRRRGDVWDRLPPPLRRYRTVKGVLLIYVFAVFLPMELTHQWEHTHANLRLALMGGAFVGIALMFAVRRRAVDCARTRSSVSTTEAAALVNTPTWQVSMWRRPPAAGLLRGAPTPMPAPRKPGDTPTTLTR